MKTTKMNLANIQGKLSRSEMRNIMAGSGDGGLCGVDCNAIGCRIRCNGVWINGTCSWNSWHTCLCWSAC